MAARRRPIATRRRIPAERPTRHPGHRLCPGKHGELLDISRQDLQELLQGGPASRPARAVGTVRCQDVMSRDLVVTTPQALAMEAWHLLSHHQIKALPVVDEGEAGRHHHPARPDDRPGGSPAEGARPEHLQVADLMTREVRRRGATSLSTIWWEAFSDGGCTTCRWWRGQLVGIITSPTWWRPCSPWPATRVMGGGSRL